MKALQVLWFLSIICTTSKGAEVCVYALRREKRGHDVRILICLSKDAQTFLFNNPLKKSKLLLSLINVKVFPVGLSSQPSSSAMSSP